MYEPQFSTNGCPPQPISPNSLHRHPCGSDVYQSTPNSTTADRVSIIGDQPCIWDLHYEFEKLDSKLISKRRAMNFKWRLDHGTILLNWHKKNHMQANETKHFKPRYELVSEQNTLVDNNYDSFESTNGPHAFYDQLYTESHLDPPRNDRFNKPFSNNVGYFPEIPRQSDTQLFQAFSEQPNQLSHTNQFSVDPMKGFDLDNSFQLDNIPLAFNGLEEPPMVPAKETHPSKHDHYIVPSSDITEANMDFEPLQMYNFFDGLDFQLSNPELFHFGHNDSNYSSNATGQPKFSSAVSKGIRRRKPRPNIKPKFNEFSNQGTQLATQMPSMSNYSQSGFSASIDYQNLATQPTGADQNIYQSNGNQRLSRPQHFNSPYFESQLRSEGQMPFEFPINEKPMMKTPNQEFPSTPQTNTPTESVKSNKRSSHSHSNASIRAKVQTSSALLHSHRTPAVSTNVSPALQGSQKNRTQEDMQCRNCKTHTTPLWRRDNDQKLLCNACGLFVKLHGTDRPLKFKTDVIKRRNRQFEEVQFSGSRRRNRHRIDRIMAGREHPIAPSPQTTESPKSQGNSPQNILTK